MHDLTRTVAAVATPPGRGGVGCIRLSGPDAEGIAKRLFVAAGRRVPTAGGPPVFGRFRDLEGEPVDHGFLVLFPSSSSFTGEPSSELWTHGSPVVQRALMGAALAAGASPAGPGEFTYRALRNRRIDLSRAEAIRDLVAARTAYQARQALARAEGALAGRIAPLRERLADALARGEAAVEFVDESEVHLASGELPRAIEAALAESTELLRGFRLGRLVRSGATVAIVGAPNVGKSSLFNRLLARERAIVSSHPGTTRDTLEDAVELAGIPVTLVDTAGLRDADDPVEAEGVRRAHAAREGADLEILVLDGSRPLAGGERKRLDRQREGPEPCRTVLAVNKSDLPSHPGLPPEGPSTVRVSAVTGEGIDTLREAIRVALVGHDVVDDPLIVDARHAEALRRATLSLEAALGAARAGLSEEATLEDLRDALGHLGEITGETATEDLYERIFSTFCIGK